MKNPGTGKNAWEEAAAFLPQHYVWIIILFQPFLLNDFLINPSTTKVMPKAVKADRSIN